MAKKELHRIHIKTKKGSNGLTNARIYPAFKNVFGEEPVMFRKEGNALVVHTPLKLTEKKVRRFASNLGSYTDLEGSDNSYSFRL